MNETVTWHGHSNFHIAWEGGSLVIDPFFTNNPKAVVTLADAPKPDYVLLTHMHGDHVGDTVALCHHHGAKLVCAVTTSEAMVAKGVPQESLFNGIGMNIGGTVPLQGAFVTMTEAFHTSEAGAPTGFIVRLPSGYTLYHSGDTGIFANMATWGALFPIDLALLPVGDVFTMDGRQAAMAAKMLGAKAAVPMHYGTFPRLAQTPDAFIQHLEQSAPACRCKVMQPGQTLSLPL